MRFEQLKDHPLYFTQVYFTEKGHWCDRFIVNDVWYAVLVVGDTEFPVSDIRYEPNNHGVLFTTPDAEENTIVPYDEEFKLIVYSRLEVEL